MPRPDRVNAPVHGFNAAPIFDILNKLQDKLPLAPHRHNTAQAQFESAKHKIVEACSLEMGRVNRNQARIDEVKDQTIADLQQTVKELAEALARERSAQKSGQMPEESQEVIALPSIEYEDVTVFENDVDWEYKPDDVSESDSSPAPAGESTDNPIIIPDSPPPKKCAPAQPAAPSPITARFLKRAREEEEGTYEGLDGKRPRLVRERDISPIAALGKPAFPMQTWALDGPRLHDINDEIRPRGKFHFDWDRYDQGTVEHWPLPPSDIPGHTPYQPPGPLVEFKYWQSHQRPSQSPEPHIKPGMLPSFPPPRLGDKPPVSPTTASKLLFSKSHTRPLKKPARQRRKRRSSSPVKVFEDETAWTHPIDPITERYTGERELLGDGFYWDARTQTWEPNDNWENNLP